MSRTALERKLKDLVDCVLAKAAADPAFAEELEAILLTDAARKRGAGKTVGRGLKHTFNPVLYLKDHGEAALQKELEKKTDDDLRGILRAQGLRKGKELKTLERPQMLQEVVSGAKTKLKQGTVVARVEASDQTSPAVTDGVKSVETIKPSDAGLTAARDEDKPKPESSVGGGGIKTDK